MEIDGGLFEIAMSEQDLDSAEVSACFQKVRCKTVPQRMWMDVLILEPGLDRSLLAGGPEHLRGDRAACGVPPVARKQPVLGLPPQSSPPGAQFFEQRGTQHDIAILASLTAADVNDHPFTVDVGDLQSSDFSTTCARGIKRHEQDAMERRLRRVNQPRDLVLAEYLRKAQHLLRIRRLGNAPAALQYLDVEEAQCCEPLRDVFGDNFQARNIAA